MITSYSLAVGDRMVATSERLDELTAGPSWAAHALAAMRAADAAHTGQTDRARELVDRALGGDLLLAHQDRGMWGTSHLLVALAELDDHERGIAVGLQIEELAEREGSANGRARPSAIAAGSTPARATSPTRSMRFGHRSRGRSERAIPPSWPASCSTSRIRCWSAAASTT